MTNELMTLGARCGASLSGECGAGLCCVRVHGERMCRSRLRLMQRCYVPRGGLDYSLNELCSCAEGLVCRDVTAAGADRYGCLTQSFIYSVCSSI